MIVNVVTTRFFAGAAWQGPSAVRSAIASPENTRGSRRIFERAFMLKNQNLRANPANTVRSGAVREMPTLTPQSSCKRGPNARVTPKLNVATWAPSPTAEVSSKNPPTSGISSRAKVIVFAQMARRPRSVWRNSTEVIAAPDQPAPSSYATGNVNAPSVLSFPRPLAAVGTFTSAINASAVGPPSLPQKLN